jgi:ATP synthase regulation protein NCA2
LFILLKLSQIVKVAAIQQVLSEVPSVSAEAQYWKERDESNISTFLFGLENLPVKAAKLAYSQGLSSLSFDYDSLSTPRASKTISTAFLGLQNRLRKPSSLFKLASETISKNRTTLDSRNKLNSHLLGKLIRKSSFQEYSQAVGLDSLFMTHSIRDSRSVYDDVALNVLQHTDVDICSLESYTRCLAKNEEFQQSSNEHTIAELYFMVKNAISYHQDGRLCHANIMTAHYRSSIFARTWIPVTLTSVSVVFLLKTISWSSLAAESKKFISQAYETASSFFAEWILRPCKDMLATIRHKEAKLAIMGTESLASDLDSLERMVANFV